MSDKKPCVRCGRGIDEWSVLCPFCNWEQKHAPPPAAAETPAVANAYRPPPEFEFKKKGLMALGGALLLVASFGVGMFINRSDTPTRAPKTVEEQVAEHEAETVSRPRRADTPLVPVAGGEAIPPPFTSVPAEVPDGAVANDYQRTDATAVSAAEYTQIAQRAEAERARDAKMVDPRTLTGPAYAQAPRPPQPARTSTSPARPATSGQTSAPSQAPAQRSGATTRPVPEHRPLPQIRASGTARVTMIVGPDGRVQRVNIDQPLRSGSTAQLVSTLQQWRFKPAMQNGRPITAPYTVELSFER
ncbi:MAG TPA: TonB family protein [Thermoanaerobaculia bacterium]